jgi:hypothetical protein
MPVKTKGADDKPVFQDYQQQQQAAQQKQQEASQAEQIAAARTTKPGQEESRPKRKAQGTQGGSSLNIDKGGDYNKSSSLNIPSN